MKKTIIILFVVFWMVSCTKIPIPTESGSEGYLVIEGEVIPLSESEESEESYGRYLGLYEEPFASEQAEEEGVVSPEIPNGEIHVRFPRLGDMNPSPFIRQLDRILYEKAYKLSSQVWADTVAGYEEQPTAYEVDFIKTYDTAGLISFRYDYYYFQFPAAHGLSACDGITIDLEAERILQLEDFFLTDLFWKDEINDAIKEFFILEEIPLYDITEFTGIDVNQTYYLTDTGFVIVFQPYRYTPYYFGVLEVPVAFEVVKEFLKFDLASM